MRALQAASQLRPSDAAVWGRLGVAYSANPAEEDAAISAFEQATAAAPTDARPSLNLATFLSKLSRPAEAIERFYSAAGVDAEYFEEVKHPAPCTLHPAPCTLHPAPSVL